MATPAAWNRSGRRWQSGFSMIEVLVTLLIISLALLGTAGLQAYAMRLNQGSQFRTQAIFLAADLAERMEANKAAAVVDGSYVVAQTTAAGYVIAAGDACINAACPRADLAAFDLVQWQNMVADPLRLPQSSWAVTRTVAGNPSTYTITISWVDRQTDTTQGTFDAASGVGANAAGTGERFFYTATRTIFN